MRPGQAVTLNPYRPLTHTGSVPQLQVRSRRPVLQVLPPGQTAAYAGSVSGFRGASSAPPPSDAASASPSTAIGADCCG